METTLNEDFFISLFAFISFASAFAAEESNDSIEVPFSIDTEDKEQEHVKGLREELRLSPYKDALLGSDILLRPIFPEDYEGISAIYSDQKSMQYFGQGRAYTLAEVKKFASRWAKENLSSTTMKEQRWAIISHDGFTGCVFTFISKDSKRTEIAYCISPYFSGRGLTTQASKLVIEYVGGPFVATVHPENIGSRKVLEKLGFKEDPIRQGVPAYGSIRDYFY